MEKSIRRKFSDVFKEEGVNLVTDRGDKISGGARNLDIPTTQFRRWIKSKTSNAGPDKADMMQLQAELKQLRRENERLRMEREILKKAAAFFSISIIINFNSGPPFFANHRLPASLREGTGDFMASVVRSLISHPVEAKYPQDLAKKVVLNRLLDKLSHRFKKRCGSFFRCLAQTLV